MFVEISIKFFIVTIVIGLAQISLSIGTEISEVAEQSVTESSSNSEDSIGSTESNLAAIARAIGVTPKPFTVSPPNSKTESKNKLVPTTELLEDLLNWEAPSFFRERMPYYLAGYDDEARPVWVAEFGKYPLKELGELNDRGSPDMEKYINQLALRVIESIHAQNTSEVEVTEAFAILDFEGMNFYDVVNPKTALMIIRIFQGYKDIIINHVGACIAINVNYVAELAISLARPMIGRAYDRIEFFGTNTAKWKSVLRRRLPLEVIPDWYGGSKDFKPLKVYG